MYDRSLKGVCTSLIFCRPAYELNPTYDSLPEILEHCYRFDRRERSARRGGFTINESSQYDPGFAI